MRKYIMKPPSVMYRPPIHRFPATVFRVRQTRPKFPNWELRRLIMLNAEDERIADRTAAKIQESVERMFGGSMPKTRLQS